MTYTIEQTSNSLQMIVTDIIVASFFFIEIICLHLDCSTVWQVNTSMQVSYIMNILTADMLFIALLQYKDWKVNENIKYSTY